MRTTTRKIRFSAIPLALAAAAFAAPAQAQHPATGAPGAVPQLFDVAGSCMACHNGLTSPAGADISFGTDWRPSMMANAARDPYWQAAVRREALEHPEAAAALQDECAKCHMPMARFQAHAEGREYEAFSRYPWRNAAGPMAAQAADGVSCTMCHQIQPEGLGDEETFTGGFHVDRQMPLGQRPVYGPYHVPRGSAQVMLSAGLFQPTTSDHVQGSELCASCHTLYTHARAGGEVVGELPEQVPYLEWLHSDYAAERNCQSCHMPVVEGDAPISSVLPNPRPEVSQHVFRGGNFFMPRVFNMFRDDLAVQALPIELEAMALRTREHLRTRTARIQLDDATLDREAGRLRFTLDLASLAGHKLPSAYPSRRAWLQIAVTDAEGRTVFESGTLRPDGSIVGNDNDLDAARFEPHHIVISSSDQVQLYEAIMVDPEDRVTTGLINAVRYAKDNRLLPRGFDKTTAGSDIAVHGAAARDADFVGGGDRVRYEVPVDPASGPFEVRALLLYQPIGFRWARNLGAFESEETDRFVRFYDALAGESAALLAEATGVVE